MLDFAVDVRAAEAPSWLVERLTARLDDLGRYLGADDHRRAEATVASRHGRHPDEVLPLAGGAAGFADAVPGDPQSLPGLALPDVLGLCSLTTEVIR